MQPTLESIQFAEHESLTVHRFRRDGFPFVWHLHPELELTLIVDGAGQRYVGDSVEEFGPGDLVLLGGNLPHTWHAPVTGGDSCASVVVFFNASTVPDLPEMQPIRRLIARADRGLAFTRNASDQLASMMGSLVDADPFERWRRFIGVMHHLSGASAEGLSSSVFERRLAPHDSEQIDRVCEWVAAHLDGELRQADAARLVGRTPSSFARFFKRLMGQTFVDYVVQLRIGRACRRLIETDASITSICYEVGFGNLSYFNRCFRRHRGVTPREYRRAFAARE